MSEVSRSLDNFSLHGNNGQKDNSFYQDSNDKDSSEHSFDKSDHGYEGDTNHMVGELIAIVALVIFLICLLSICMKCERRNRSETTERRRQAAIRVAIERGNTDPGQASESKKEALEIRKECIQKFLKTEKYKEDTEQLSAQEDEKQDDDGSIPSNKTKSITASSDIDDIETGSDENHNSNTEAESESVVLHDHCAICQEKFENDDEVCSSHNSKCRHIYHRECMFEWLLRQDNCPICRREFLSSFSPSPGA